MSDQMEEIMPTTESPDKIGSKFTRTNKRSLEDISRELLLHTKHETKVDIWNIERILGETLDTIVHLTSIGNTVRMPHGLLGIVILQEVDEFSDIGISSKLFPKERLVLGAFQKELMEWGYENIPSGRINRTLRKRLKVPKCATKIKLANEAGVLRYYHFEGDRKYRE